MTVSGVGIKTSILASRILDLQSQFDSLQTQLATGKKSNTYAGMGVNRGFAVALRAQVSSIDAFACECLHRIVDDLDVLEVAPREAREPVGRKRALGRRSRRDEPRSRSTQLSQHRVGVLVEENRDDECVVARWKPVDEVARTVGIVRTVPDLAVPLLEAARECDCRGGRDRMPDERFRGLTGAAHPHFATGDEVRVGPPGEHDDRILGGDRELLLRDRLERGSQHIRVLEPDVRE